MASNCIESYMAISQRIGQMFPQARLIFNNFEHNLHTSLMNSIPRPVMIRGSFLKYCTILYQKAVEYEIPNNAENDTIIIKLMALAIIDPNDVINTFIAIRTGLSLPLMRTFHLFFAYYELYWLREIGPHNFTVIISLPCIIINNNISALYDCQRASASTLRHHPPAFNSWEYLRSIVVHCEKLHNDLGRLRNGVRTVYQVPRVRPVLNVSVVQDLWRRLQAQSMTVADALAAISSELVWLFEQLRFNNEGMPSDFELLNSSQPLPRDPWNEDGVDLGRLRNGVRTVYQVPRVRPVLNVSVVQDLWRRLQAQSMTVADALAAISSELVWLFEQLRFNNEGMPSDFELLNSSQPLPTDPWNEDGVAPMNLEEILQRSNYRMRARRQGQVRAHDGGAEVAGAAPPVVQDDQVVPGAQQADLPGQQYQAAEWMMDVSCIICCDARRNRICSPCGHIIFCDSCATRFAHEAHLLNPADDVLCPVCHRIIAEMTPAYVI